MAPPLDHDDDHDRGLQFDMSTLLARRHVLSILAGAGVATFLAACGSGDGDSTATSAPAGTTGAAGGSCATIAEETAGPYPGDGSNGPNVLTESGVVRSDIRASFGDSTTVAEGVPLTIELQVTDTAAGCAPLVGAAVYVWHCDRDGNYSMYSAAAGGENFLRGVQETDADGRVTFTSIFPAAYSGRWPHVHFEVYPSVDAAASAGALLATSQLAFPADACDAVYATAGYEQSVRNLAQTSLESDMVFADGVDQQLATMSGSVTDGFVATLAVAV